MRCSCRWSCQAWRTCSHGLWSYHAFHLHLWLPLFPSYVRPRLKRPFSFSKLLGRLYASGVAERLRKVLAGATVVLSLSLILRLRVHHLRVTLLFASVLCCSDVFRSVVLSCCTLRFAVIYFIYCPLSPMSWKKPLWSPLLKLPSLDPEQFPNYRPISNLMFISKLCERVVAVQLTKYLTDNFLMEQLQSAYKPSHSPESALWKVEDDILQAIDNDQRVILLLLDLSAVFGTVHHHILLARLTDRFGIDDKAHSLFKSYLSGQMHFAAIGSARSSSLPLNWGFPQGSVLGPILYLLYGDLLGDTMRHQNVSFHFYADDEQLYVRVPMGWWLLRL